MVQQCDAAHLQNRIKRSLVHHLGTSAKCTAPTVHRWPISSPQVPLCRGFYRCRRRSSDHQGELDKAMLRQLACSGNGKQTGQKKKSAVAHTCTQSAQSAHLIASPSRQDTPCHTHTHSFSAEPALWAVQALPEVSPVFHKDVNPANQLNRTSPPLPLSITTAEMRRRKWFQRTHTHKQSKTISGDSSVRAR